MVKKNILIIGSGGREHALGWKLKQFSQVGKIFFSPGTTGTETVGENTNISSLDFEKLIKVISLIVLTSLVIPIKYKHLFISHSVVADDAFTLCKARFNQGCVFLKYPHWLYICLLCMLVLC